VIASVPNFVRNVTLPTNDMIFTLFRPHVSRNLLAVALGAVGFVAVIGCGKSSGLQDIEGRVTHKDGSPLVGATVMYRSADSHKYATGVTDNDGHYTLGTSHPGEGIAPGNYSITVMENRGDEDNMRPPTIHRKYSLPSKSGLTFKVEPGGKSTFDMELDPP
jgi:Carboxypeptidase regulatory-like domain